MLSLLRVLIIRDWVFFCAEGWSNDLRPRLLPLSSFYEISFFADFYSLRFATDSNSSGWVWITLGGSFGRQITQSLAIDCLLLWSKRLVDPKLDFEFLVVPNCALFFVTMLAGVSQSVSYLPYFSLLVAGPTPNVEERLSDFFRLLSPCNLTFSFCKLFLWLTLVPPNPLSAVSSHIKSILLWTTNRSLLNTFGR